MVYHAATWHLWVRLQSEKIASTQLALEKHVDQSPENPLWIRNEFLELDLTSESECKVIHLLHICGHSDVIVYKWNNVCKSQIFMMDWCLYKINHIC